MLRKPLLLLLCTTSVLLLQATGLHLHLDGGQASSLHGEHNHVVGDVAHDHADDSDVSLFKIGAVWAKLVAIVLPALFVFLLLDASQGRTWLNVSPHAGRVRRYRWRPLLRAPPHLI